MRTCRNCGQVTEMMCQQGTGFCSANCEDDYATIRHTIWANSRSWMQFSDRMSG